MKAIPLGAGQEIGKSCVIVASGNRVIMFDCGMHIGYSDSRMFPDFSFLSRTGEFDAVLDAIVISHFHLDHCGALPYFTEILGYSGPIYMTPPTHAVMPILLSDCQKILESKCRDRSLIYNEHQIESCMRKIRRIEMNETIQILSGTYLRPYYAGHVIGAAMFYLIMGDEKIVYTGDYNTNADRHLCSAWIDSVKPDLLITEATYGSLIRDCRRARERKFLQMIHECVKRGGVALIPIFALGRAQELCLLLESYWERMGLQVPIYITGALTEKANEIYKKYINYTKCNFKENLTDKNMFDFKFIKPYVRNAEFQGPCVIFSTPAMLHSGMSLKIFGNICHSENNLLILPGYCVRGTLGDQVLCGSKEIEIHNKKYVVRLQIENLSFSAHADVMGIMKIIEQCKPKKIMLVHGSTSRMQSLARTIKRHVDIEVYMPQNGTVIDLPNDDVIDLRISRDEYDRYFNGYESEQVINISGDLLIEKDGLVITNTSSYETEDVQK